MRKVFKSALWVQLVKHRGVKTRKEGEDTFREERRGREQWMSRKGYWRQIQREAGSRTETDWQKKKQSIERRGGGRAAASVSLLLPSGSVAACFYLNSPGLNSVALRSLNDETTELTSTTRAYYHWAQSCLRGMRLKSLTGMESTQTDPSITEELSLSRGKLTHTVSIY